MAAILSSRFFSPQSFLLPRINLATIRPSNREHGVSSAMFVLSMRFFGEPIRGPLGTYDGSLWPFTRPHSLRIVNPRATVPPYLACGLSQNSSPRHCGGGFAFFMTRSLLGLCLSRDRFLRLIDLDQLNRNHRVEAARTQSLQVGRHITESDLLEGLNQITLAIRFE